MSAADISNVFLLLQRADARKLQLRGLSTARKVFWQVIFQLVCNQCFRFLDQLLYYIKQLRRLVGEYTCTKLLQAVARRELYLVFGKVLIAGIEHAVRCVKRKMRADILPAQSSAIVYNKTFIIRRLMIEKVL